MGRIIFIFCLLFGTQTVCAAGEATRMPGLGTAFILVLLLLLLVLVFVLLAERKRLALHECTTEIKELLLGVNHQVKSVENALAMLLEYGDGAFSFFRDKGGIYHSAQAPGKKVFSAETRELLYSQLFRYGKDNRGDKNSTSVFLLRRNKSLQQKQSELYRLMEQNGIEHLCFAYVGDSENKRSICGLLNPSNHTLLKALLEDVAICFSMAINDRQHLLETEELMVTDELTGLKNHTCYNMDVAELEKNLPNQLALIFVDVNELHTRNSLYGHEAGDEMLIAVGEAISCSFGEFEPYHMGGDEFFVLTVGLAKEELEARIQKVIEATEALGYSISVGYGYTDEQTKKIEELEKEAEKNMYVAKAAFYQERQHIAAKRLQGEERVRDCSNREVVEACLPVLEQQYLAIQLVSFSQDSAQMLTVPTYFQALVEESNGFYEAMVKYVRSFVVPEEHRALCSFMEYDALRAQLKQGLQPQIVYRKIDGTSVLLRICGVVQNGELTDQAVWTFEQTTS